MTVAGSLDSARAGVPVAVARQPILDRAEAVRGYELLYRPAGAAALGPDGATSNVIVRALGMKDTVKVDTRFESPRVGDVLLLCSDGLCGPVNDQRLLDTVTKYGDLTAATQRLIETANENGGPDNITCVLARWVE